MARKLRVEYPGAIYHVMNRGDRREAIFTEDQDRLLFLETLGEACVKTDWQVHAWCLMGNHFCRAAQRGPHKLRIAVRLREETTMTLAWMAQRLSMGAASHVACLLYRQAKKLENSENALF